MTQSETSSLLTDEPTTLEPVNQDEGPAPTPITYVRDLPLPLYRSQRKKLRVREVHWSYAFPSQIKPRHGRDEIIPRVKDHPLFPLLSGTQPPPITSRTGLSLGRFYYPHHVFNQNLSLWPDPKRVHQPYAERPDFGPPQEYTFRSRSSKNSLPIGTLAGFLYPFAATSKVTTLDMSFYPHFVEGANMAWSHIFALYLAGPYETIAAGDTLLLPVAGLMHHQALPLMTLSREWKDVLGRPILNPSWSLGCGMAATTAELARAHPIGNPRGYDADKLDAPHCVTQYVANNLMGCSPGVGFAFQEMTNTASLPRVSSMSGANATGVGGDKARPSRSEKQMHFFLSPTQFYAKDNPRPFALTNEALRHLVTPLVPGMSAIYFNRVATNNGSPWSEAARDGGLVADICEAVKQNGGTEEDGLRKAWQAYYRLMLGYFYHFGGDFTVIEGLENWTADDAAKRRAMDPFQAHGATCVHTQAIERLAESLRLVTNWLLAINPTAAIPMEPELVGQMKLAHPFAFEKDPWYLDVDPSSIMHIGARYRGTTAAQLMTEGISKRVAPQSRVKIIHRVGRKTIIHRGPKLEEEKQVPLVNGQPSQIEQDYIDHAMTHGIAYNPDTSDLYTKHRAGALRAEALVPGHEDKLIYVPNLAKHLTQSGAAYLLKAGSNAAIGPAPDRLARGGPFDYGAREITDAAYQVLGHMVGMDVANDKAPGVIRRLALGDRFEAMHGMTSAFRSPGWKSRYVDFANENPNFTPGPFGTYHGLINNNFFIPDARDVDGKVIVDDLRSSPHYWPETVARFKIRSLIRARMLSWGEYLNDSIHVYNKLIDDAPTMTPSSPSGQRFKRAELPSIEAIQSEKFFPKGFEFFHVGYVLHYGIKPDLDHLNKRFVTHRDKCDELRQERKQHAVNSHAYKRVSALLYYHEAQRDKVDAKVKAMIAKTVTPDAIRNLIYGLALYDEPYNVRPEGHAPIMYMSKHDIAARAARHKITKHTPAKFWGALSPHVSRDDGAAERKRTFLREQAYDVTPIPSDLSDEEHKLIADAIVKGEYYHVETLAAIGAQDVAFDRTFAPFHDYDTWAGPLLRVYDEIMELPDHSAFKRHFRGDSVQFALARIAYYFLVNVDRYLTHALRTTLDNRFDQAFTHRLAGFINEKDRAGGAPVMFKNDPARDDMLYELATTLHGSSMTYCELSELFYTYTCPSFAEEHRMMFDAIRDRLLRNIQGNVGAREDYRRELKRAELGVPSMTLIDMVANNRAEVVEQCAAQYLAKYQEIATEMDRDQALMTFMIRHSPHNAVAMRRMRELLTGRPSPGRAIERTVANEVAQSKQTDNQHQPDVFHYARVLNEHIEAALSPLPQTLVDEFETVDALGYEDELQVTDEPPHNDAEAKDARQSFKRLANRLTDCLSTLFIRENPDYLDDTRHDLLTTQFAVGYQDNDPAVAPVLMSNWRTRVDARNLALDMKRRARTKTNKLYRVTNGALISPYAFIYGHIARDWFARIVEHQDKSVMLGTLTREFGWPIADGEITPTKLRVQRRTILHDLMGELCRGVDRDKTMRSMVPAHHFLGGTPTMVGLSATPWWWAAVAHAMTRYLADRDRTIDLSGVIGEEAMALYLARGPKDGDVSIVESQGEAA